MKRQDSQQIPLFGKGRIEAMRSPCMLKWNFKGKT